MFGKLADVFRTDDAVARIGEGFDEMLDRAREVVLLAGCHYFDGPPTAEERKALIKADVKVNKLERKLRKKIATHLALSDGADAIYGLLLMSLVKDAERIGDYAKNLSEIYQEGGGDLPPEGDPVLAELMQLRETAEALLNEVARVFSTSDAEAASGLILRGVTAGRQADALLRPVAEGPYDAATAVTLILGARFYKRISAHVVNILTGVIMPIHKLDYYDEDEISRLRDSAEDDEDGDDPSD